MSKRVCCCVQPLRHQTKQPKNCMPCLVGDPGLAKSQLLKESVKLVPNSKYESVQFATGKSLTAIVTKDEGDALILRIGPIPQAKGAIAALNEMGRMMPRGSRTYCWIQCRNRNSPQTSLAKTFTSTPQLQ